MAIKVPLIESSVSPVSTQGLAPMRDPNRGVVQALSNLGASLTELGKRHEEKKAKTKIYDAERKLREESRTKFEDAQVNRLGRDALPNEDEGLGSVYDDYDAFSRDFVGTALKDIDPGYQDVARQSLEGVADRYRDRFAAFQTQQQINYRKEVLTDNINQIKNDLYVDLQSGMGVETFLDAKNQIEELTRSESRGGNVEAFLNTEFAGMAKDSVLSIASENPYLAKEMLDDKEFQKFISPATKEALDATVEQKRVEFDANQIVSRIKQSAGDDYVLQLELLEGIETDQDVAEKVTRQLEFENRRDEKIRTEKQYNVISEVYDDIFDRGTPPTPIEVDRGARFAELEPQQKLMIKSWLKDENAGQFSDAERLDKWYAARQEIIGLRMDPAEIMRKAGSDIDMRDVKSLISFAETVRREPNIRAADDYLQGLYPRIAGNEKKRKKALFQIQQDVFGFQAINSRFPSGAEMKTIVQNAVEPDIETDFQDFIFGIPVGASDLEQSYRNFNPEAERPRYSQDDPPSFIEKQIFVIRQSGYPDAVFDADTGMIDLGVQPDGYRYAITPDKQIFKRKEID